MQLDITPFSVDILCKINDWPYQFETPNIQNPFLWPHTQTKIGTDTKIAFLSHEKRLYVQNWALCWSYQNGYLPLLICVSTSRVATLINIGLDTKIMFLCLVQVILNQKLSSVVAMLDLQDGCQPFLVSVCTSRMAT